ncbi:MAG: GNAT family N-acetyltransferase [Alphaproteobacteria bacterium]|nr:GNAT family N-acetyltransferase [Alphaproteobacteria bacterium]
MSRRKPIDVPDDIGICTARTGTEISEIRSLFLEYAESLNFDLCFQGFDEEVATLPGRYAAPDGELFLATVDRAYAGCIGARPIGDGICEMKRLYVRPAYRGVGLGRILACRIIDWARRAGYQAMRLDTVDTMVAAKALYRDLGFHPVAAYYDNPADQLEYYELRF